MSSNSFGLVHELHEPQGFGNHSSGPELQRSPPLIGGATPWMICCNGLQKSETLGLNGLSYYAQTSGHVPSHTDFGFCLSITSSPPSHSFAMCSRCSSRLTFNSFDYWVASLLEI